MIIRRVDFHIQDDEGRVLALVDAAQLDSLQIGQTVSVEDYEGNRVKAEVAAIDRPRSLVALELQRDSLEVPERNDWIDEDQSEYERFERLAKSLVSVPKDEIES